MLVTLAGGRLVVVMAWLIGGDGGVVKCHVSLIAISFPH